MQRSDAVVILDDPSAPIPTGWRTIDGFELGERTWDVGDQRLVCRGRVHDEATASAAILAATRGAGLQVEVQLAGQARHRFLEDLDRVTRPSAAPSSDPHHLPDEQRALLDLLASGMTVTAAATELHRSRRTVNRLLADARARLGVASTAEAVARWTQLRS